MDNKFRGTAFGGFKRRDVIDYLERSAAEHNEQLTCMQAQVEQAQKEQDELEKRIGELNAQVEALTEEAAQAAQLPAAQEEIRRLQERVASLEPDARAYAAIRERAANMELEAHQRAQAIVDEARKQVDETLAGARTWLTGLRREYGELRLQVENTTAHAVAELERVRQGLGNVTLCMDRQKNAVDQFLRATDKKTE